MKYNIIEKRDYIVFDVFEEYDFDLLMELISVIKSECDTHQINKVVIDGSKVINLFHSEEERFDLAEEISQQFGNQIKVAAVARKEDITDYIGNIAQKRGAKYKVFSNLDMALEWLLN